MNFFEHPDLYDGIFTHIPSATPTKGEPDGPLFGNGDLGAVWGVEGGALCCWIGKNDMWRAAPTQQGGGVKSLAVLRLESVALDGAAFSARQHLQSAEVTTVLSREDARLRVTGYAPYHQSMIVVHLEAIQGNIDLCLNLDTLPDPNAIRERRIEANRCVLEKRYEGDNLLWPTCACVAMCADGWPDMKGVLRAGETLTLILTACTNHDSDH